MSKAYKAVVTTGAALVMVTQANAQVADTIAVSADVVAPAAVCTIDVASTEDLAFTDYTQNQATSLTLDSDLVIDCTVGGSVTISMSGNPTRAMSSPTTNDQLSYIIDRPSGGAWGNGVDAFTTSLSAGSNAVVMAGVVAANQGTLPGTDYADSVNVTISF